MSITQCICISVDITGSRDLQRKLNCITSSRKLKGKGKVRPRTGHEGPERGRDSSTLSLTSVLDRGGWLTPCPSRFTHGKDTWYPLYGRVGGSQGRSGRVRKIWPPPGFDPPYHPARSESLYRLSCSSPPGRKFTFTN